MPNYSNYFVDPGQGMRESMNSLVNLATMKRADETNALNRSLAINQDKRAAAQEQRAQTAAKLQNAAAQFKFMTEKSKHLSTIAKNVSAAPYEMRGKKYSELLEIAKLPIVTTKETGPLGIVDTSEFLTPDEFVKLNNDGQKQYLELLSISADDLAEIRLSDTNAMNKVEELAARMKNKTEEIRLNKEADIAVERVKGEERRKTDEERRKTDAADKIDEYQKELARIAKAMADIDSGSEISNLTKQLIAASGGSISDSGATSKDEAKKKLQAYEQYLKEQISKLQSSSTWNNNDPLGLGL